MVENSSCWKVGLRIHLPSTRPTRTAAIGPFHGTVETLSATEAATSAEHVGVVLLVGGDHVDEDLDFVLEALRGRAAGSSGR